MYGKFTAVKGVSLAFAAEPGARPDRALGLRQVHLPPHPQPDARAVGGRLDHRPGAARRRGHLRAAGERRCSSGAGSGMVFQRPTPFPTMSIYDNVAAGLRVNGRLRRAELDGVVERSLRQAALWDEVKDRLQRQRDGALGRTAAAALHRAHHRAVARRDPARRADRVARSPGHPADRGAGLRAQAATSRSSS